MAISDFIIKVWDGTDFVEAYPKTTHEQIIASGIPDASSYLRGDGVWSALPANALNVAGYVAAPTAATINKVWKTDESGNPAWRDETGGADIMSSTVDGVAKLFSNTVQSVAANTVSATASRTYGLQLNGSGQLVVNVPWSNTTYSTFTNSANGLVPTPDETGSTKFLRQDGSWVVPEGQTYGQATSSVYGLVKIGYTENSKNYPIELDVDGKMFVNVPWVDTNTTYSTFTTTTNGLVPTPGETGSTKFLRQDGSWVVPTDTNTTYSVFNTTTDGLVPKTTTSNTTDYLRRDGTWATPPNTNTTYVQATTSTLGLVKLGVAAAAATLNSATTTASRFYRVGALTTGEMYVNVPWVDTDTIYTLSLAADGTRGGIQIGYTENGKNYPVELSSEKAFVNVPWTDTVYTHPTYTRDDTSSSVSPGYAGTFTVVDSVTATNGHITAINLKTVTMPSEQTIPAQLTSKNIIAASNTATANAVATNGNVHLNHLEDSVVTSSHKLIGSGATTVVSDLNGHITISSTNTTYALMTSTVLGLGKLFSNTVQSVAANAVSTEASRTYGIQVNASGQLVVNVPWVDTDTVYTHPTYSLTQAAGTETTLTDITLIDSLTTNSTGHLTGATWRKLVAGSNVTITPAADGNITISSTDTNTDTHYTAANFIGATGTQTNAVTANGATYLKLVENATIRSSHLIQGSGATTVVSDANGNITISSTDNNTLNTAGSTDTSSKIFLVGATLQAANPQTYSDNEVFATNGVLNAKTFTSTVATGTAPLTVTSTTPVANLQAATATKLHTTRAITVGPTAKNFDGSAAITYTLAEIGINVVTTCPVSAGTAGRVNIYTGAACATKYANWLYFETT